MNTVKRRIKQVFRQFDIELTTLSNAHKAGLRPDLARLIAMTQPATIFDVGANIGQFGYFLRKDVGFTGQIFSFEPIPELSEALATKVKSDTKWHVFPFALGAAATTLKLNVASSTDFSSFLKFADNTQSLFPAASTQSTIQVEVKTLSDFILTQQPAFPFLLKLDTQGFDMEVINGCLEELKDCVGILCEVSVIPLYQGQPAWRDVISRLEQLGFGVVGLYPVNRTRSMQVIEFDCLMINARWASS